MAADPSHNVHPDLLPHIHLISAYRYPLVPRFGIPEVTEWLLNAPRIARDGAPFFWTFLDTPQDGTIILTWQPLQRLGTEFASDGYVWPRGEVYYQHEIRDGLILEVFHQPVGYRPGEEYATHSRRRFRLMPPKVPNPNAPQVDPSLWLVHYGPIDEREPIPVKKIRLEPRLRTIMEHRNNLQRAGQITRKEFMLSDRVNWPQIPLPRDARAPPMYAAGGAGGAGGPASAHHVPQQMAYPTHPPGNLAPPPPSKRARHAASAAAAAAGAGHHAGGPGMVPGGPGITGPPQHMVPAMDVAIYEDEEDTSRGDMFDIITPRDVSVDRYKQNHEWMEEVISSPYRIGQIGYADLGLGLKGELAPVTEGIFEGQGFEAFQRVPQKPYVGRLDAGLAEEFRRRANEKIDATNAEIAEMKARHEKLVANFHLNSVIKKAEHDLRFSADGTGSEVWRLEGRLDDVGATNGSGDAGDGRWSHQKHHKTVDEVVTLVESSLGRQVAAAGLVTRVQDGGYREPTPEPEPEPEPEPIPEVPTISTTPAAPGVGSAAPGSVSLSQHPSPAGSQISGIMIGDADIDMGDTAAGLLDQMESVFTPASTPGNFPTPTPHATLPATSSGLSNVATPSATAAGPSPQNPAQPPASAAVTGSTPVPANANREAADTAMEDAGQGPTEAGSAAQVASTAGPDSAAVSNDDWVVVPPGGGVSPAAGDSANVPPAGEAAVVPPPTEVSATLAPSVPAPTPALQGVEAATETTAPAGVAAVPTVRSTPDAVASAPISGIGSKPESAVPTPGDNNDFGSLEDLDTAGEALAGLDDGLDLHMDMEDSAFGDAFHGSGAD